MRISAEKHAWVQAEGVTGYWRVLHTEELHGVYCSPILSVRIDGQGMWHTGQKRSAYRVLVGRCQGTWLHGRLRHGSDYNIEMDVKETE